MNKEQALKKIEELKKFIQEEEEEWVKIAFRRGAMTREEILKMSEKEYKRGGIDFSQDNIFDAIERPDIKKPKECEHYWTSNGDGTFCLLCKERYPYY